MSSTEDQLTPEPAEAPTGAPAPTHISERMRILEALLFASEEVLTAARIKAILPGQPDGREIRTLVHDINLLLQKERHPFEIIEVAGGYQLRTIPYYSTWVRQLFKDKTVKRLSMQALECLAIIAYRQPITKADIEAVRGVVSDGAMKTLFERRLITISGRSEKAGRPLLYTTTKEFLTYFGLRTIEDLPRLEEFEALAREKMGDLEEELAASSTPAAPPPSEEEQSGVEPVSTDGPLPQETLPPPDDTPVAEDEIPPPSAA